MRKPSKSIGVRRIVRQVRVIREPEGRWAGYWGVWIGMPMVAVRVEHPDNSRAFAMLRARNLREMLCYYADGMKE